jgi:hypothetical protein
MAAVGSARLASLAMGAITEQQLNFLHTFGFLRLPGLFADEIEESTSGWT